MFSRLAQRIALKTYLSIKKNWRSDLHHVPDPFPNRRQQFQRSCVESIPAQVNSGCAVDRHNQRAAWCPGRLVSALKFLDTQQLLEPRQVAHKITDGYKCTCADDTRKTTTTEILNIPTDTSDPLKISSNILLLASPSKLQEE